MNTKDAGGSAFPVPAEVNWKAHVGEQSGMSMRDYFAAKAMQAMVNSPQYVDGSWMWHDIAVQAYDMADAMLKARQA
jgi:hypothetical protein